MKYVGYSAIAAILMSGYAIAQTPAPTAPSSPPAATAPAPATKVTTPTGSVTFKSGQEQNEIVISSLIGTDVRNTAGEDLGDINDVVLNPAGGAVAIIGVGGFLGLGEKDVGVPMEQIQFTVTNDGTRVAQLEVSKQALEAAPQFALIPKTQAAPTSGTRTQ